ncbi:hypothetical protein E2C01_102677 [Portunus trituberculatus]|uniref:Uncharacterized protein n=1 Tax=Portunus trituberculatus TaxID=210409 RepID=A0A5B7KJ17_PORTR|nr:hypothetical protein [Portunus trituberculatus]
MTPAGMVVCWRTSGMTAQRQEGGELERLSAGGWMRSRQG